MRNLQDWMSFDQEQVNQFSESDWQHYSGGGCVCSAHSSGECCCGAWDAYDNSIEPCTKCAEYREECRELLKGKHDDAKEYLALKAKVNNAIRFLRNDITREALAIKLLEE